MDGKQSVLALPTCAAASAVVGIVSTLWVRDALCPRRRWKRHHRVRPHRMVETLRAPALEKRSFVPTANLRLCGHGALTSLQALFTCNTVFFDPQSTTGDNP